MENKPQQNPTKTQQSTSAGNLDLHVSTKAGGSSHLLQGFCVFQELVSVFITLVIATAIEKQKVKKY